jgi:D-alanyl-D-alanine carboxypeptidase/D-alanyl-D-alanine-endopeptidase (penicillin-binding protein 4)
MLFMSQRASIALMVCFLHFSLGTMAHAAGQDFSQLKRLEKEGATVSGIVVSLPKGEVIAEIGSDKRLTPASVSKAILAAAALEKWGSEHSFITKAFARGEKKGTVLHGDLIIEGSGDPSLTNEKLWFLATDIARTGITEVKGSLVLNTKLFGNIIKDENRQAGSKSSTHAYDSPLSAAAVNFSVLAVVGSPADRSGKAGRIALEPYPLSSIKLNGSVQTSLAGSSKKLSVLRTSQMGADTLTVSGQIPAGSLPQRVYRSVSDADRYAGEVFKAFLEHAGVTVRGGIKSEKTPISSGMTAIAAVESFPIDWQLRGLMKMSNNFIADMFTILLDTDDEKRQGATLEGGAEELELYLRQALSESKLSKGKSLNGLVLNSGSGLTPSNKLSARDVVAVLERMYFNAREFPAFLSALPIPGAEGTVKKRFSEPSAQHLQERMRAKTGTLTEPRDAVGLAGYSRLKSGEWVAFAVIVNGTSSLPNPGVERIRESIDEDLIRILPLEK